MPHGDRAANASGRMRGEIIAAGVGSGSSVAAASGIVVAYTLAVPTLTAAVRIRAGIHIARSLAGGYRGDVYLTNAANTSLWGFSGYALTYAPVGYYVPVSFSTDVSLAAAQGLGGSASIRVAVDGGELSWAKPWIIVEEL